MRCRKLGTSCDESTNGGLLGATGFRVLDVLVHGGGVTDLRVQADDVFRLYGVSDLTCIVFSPPSDGTSDDDTIPLAIAL